jgi:DNA-binding transcriptional ArsR family regulator
MLITPNELFSTLADPTRRALFERLSREGELTVRVLTGHSGVSQPAVSKHLGVLKHAGLVRDRRDGRQTHYSARPQGLAPLEACWTGWTNDRVRCRVSARQIFSGGCGISLSTTTERLQSLLIEQWLMQNDFRPVVGHRFNFRTTPMPHWNGVVDCEVLVVEPHERLS